MATENYNNMGADTKKIDFYSIDFLTYWHKEGEQHFIQWLRSEVREKISQESKND